MSVTGVLFYSFAVIVLPFVVMDVWIDLAERRAMRFFRRSGAKCV